MEVRYDSQVSPFDSSDSPIDKTLLLVDIIVVGFVVCRMDGGSSFRRIQYESDLYRKLKEIRNNTDRPTQELHLLELLADNAERKEIQCTFI